MQTLLSRFNRIFETAPKMLIPYRWVVLCVFTAVTGVMMAGMFKHFSMDMSLESWFQDDDPIKLSLDEYRDQFGSDDSVYVIYHPKDNDTFSEKSLTLIQELHQEIDNARMGLTEFSALGLLSRIERIDSLYNARYQIADGDTLISKKLIGNDFPKTGVAREARRQLAKSQDSFELIYHSKDFRYGGIRLKTDFGVVPVEAQSEDNTPVEDDLLMDDGELGFEDDDSLDISLEAEIEEIQYASMQMDEYLDFMTALRLITEQPKYEHFKFHYTGNAPVMEFAMNNMMEASILLGLMVLIVVGLLWSLFHSFSAVIWPITVIAASAFWTIGVSSWAGVTFSTMVILTFMLILAVGIADCVHVLSAYVLFRGEQHDHTSAIAMAYRKTGVPIFLTTITTMAGMLALLLSDIPQIGVFGVTSAIGVFAAFLLTIFVLPVLLDIWHPFNENKPDRNGKTNRFNQLLDRVLEKIPDFSGRHAKAIVMAYLGFFAMLMYGASNVKVDSNFAELAKEGSAIQVTFDIVDKHMMGGLNMEILLDFDAEDALKDPKVLSRIEQFQRHLEKSYPDFILKTFSLADIVKDTNKVMHEGLEEYKHIPKDPRLTAQLLYLFDSANSADRRNLVSDDYSRSHISLYLKNKGTYEYTDFFSNIQNDVRQIILPLNGSYPLMKAEATGSLTLMMELIDHIAWTQLKSFSFALLIITLIMMLTLGSIQAGFISMIPNLLPAIFTFGLMGLLDIPLDTDTLIIAPLIIGIAVDDTIHFLAHYRDSWYEIGDVDQALKNTINEVGRAVTFTSLILGLGFSVLAFSDYLGLAKPGIFGSAAIFIALSSDLVFLPALIKWLKPDLGRSRYISKQLLQAS